MGLETLAELEHLDRWFSPWLANYTPRKANEVREYLRGRVDDVDRMMQATDVEEVQNGGEAWYSNHVRHILNVAACVADHSEHAPQLQHHFWPFAEAVHRTKFFISMTQSARQRATQLSATTAYCLNERQQEWWRRVLNARFDPNINAMFNFAYDGLEGYLADERGILLHYPLVVEKAESFGWFGAEGLQDQLQYREQDARTQNAISRALLSGIHRYRPLITPRNSLRIPALEQVEFYQRPIFQ